MRNGARPLSFVTKISCYNMKGMIIHSLLFLAIVQQNKKEEKLWTRN